MKQNKNKKPRRKNKTIEPDPQGLQYYDETNLKKKKCKTKKYTYKFKELQDKN